MSNERKFEITLKQLNSILLDIQEAPARYVFQAIVTLKSLPEVNVEDKKKDKK
jgi:hypothetical protein|tara:strand:+ start:249 stop:407 length:159 start_codon:yes stop_codon:yes gene_type:complete